MFSGGLAENFDSYNPRLDDLAFGCIQSFRISSGAKHLIVISLQLTSALSNTIAGAARRIYLLAKLRFIGVKSSPVDRHTRAGDGTYQYP
jgi:hypothetical protein